MKLLCQDCGWIGDEKDALEIEVEEGIEEWIELRCPKCAGINLIELLDEGVRTLEPVYA